MKQYDLLVIGLGPAGMAATAMAVEMGFSVCAVEANKIGGECTNIGCMPSKALLERARSGGKAKNPFARVASRVEYIQGNKMPEQLQRADIVFGSAVFEDRHTIKVNDNLYTARHIIVATGTRPAVPPIPGLDSVPYLTNENIFFLDKIPQSLVVIGGGAIGCEMAQAFHGLGCTCTIVQADSHLLPNGEKAAGVLLQSSFEERGIAVHNAETISRVEESSGQIVVHTGSGKELRAEKVLVAAGRKPSLEGLGLDSIGVRVGRTGIVVDECLRTSVPNIYAAGDCNGLSLLSPAAMHQAMLIMMNLFIPWPLKRKARAYPVPWTVFTEPEVSHVGKTTHELDAAGVKYKVFTHQYEDYGGALAQGWETGYIRAYVSPWGKVLGVSIVGPHSGEMINEWSLALRVRFSLARMMLTVHSFPTMGFMSKRIAEMWAMSLLRKPRIQAILKKLRSWFSI